MKEKKQALNVFYKTFFYSFIGSLVIFLLTIPFLFFDLGEITFGLLLGEFVSYMSYFAIGFIEKKNPITKLGTAPLIAVLIIRVTILALVIVVSALLYYQYNHHIFNVIAIAGGYLIPLVILIVVTLKERKEPKDV